MDTVKFELKDILGTEKANLEKAKAFAALYNKRFGGELCIDCPEKLQEAHEKYYGPVKEVAKPAFLEGDYNLKPDSIMNCKYGQFTHENMTPEIARKIISERPITIHLFVRIGPAIPVATTDVKTTQVITKEKTAVVNK